MADNLQQHNGDNLPKKLTIGRIEHLKRLGYTQSQIAREHGVTRQAVSWHIRTYGGHQTPRQQVLEQHFPFKVPTRMSETSPYKRLRDHAEYRATGGVGMTTDQLTRLRAFYHMLREKNLVVEFDPNLPATPGVSNKGGWAYRNRQPSDGELLIRVNEYTDLAEESARWWTFPPLWP